MVYILAQSMYKFIKSKHVWYSHKSVSGAASHEASCYFSHGNRHALTATTEVVCVKPPVTNCRYLRNVPMSHFFEFKLCTVLC
jgi:hypothetical protein